MKRLFNYIIAGFVLFTISCEEKGFVSNSVTTTLTISITDSSSTAADISLSANYVKGQGALTVGVCYSTTANPTVLSSHQEVTINPDTLKEDKLNLRFEITSLTKNVRYYIKGYIKTSYSTYYSSEESFSTVTKTFTIKVSDDYISSGVDCWIMLSNKKTTILTQKIENSQTYTFEDNIPAKADFHIFKWNPSTYLLDIDSYANIVPDLFNLDYPFTTFGNAGTVSVTISDISNYLRWGIASSWWWNSTTSSSTHTLYNYVLKNPDDLFIYYIPTNSAEAPKYKYITNVTPESSYTYTMSDLASMTNYSSITLPTNEYFYYNISGYNTGYYDDYLRYYGHTYTSGYPGTFKLYYPTGLKTYYYFYGYYNTSNQQSFYNKLGTLPTTFFSTFPTITITSSDKFNSTTSSINNYSNYEVVDFYGKYSGSPTVIQWDYFKQPQASDSVLVPEFPSDIKLLINNLTTDVVSFSDVGYFDIIDSPVNSYNTYVNSLVKQSSRFYDVIKERRCYYQWINKKSNIPHRKIDLHEE